jgi:Holliday junction DNA helicase RuvA
MIAQLHGEISRKTPTRVILDVHGVGYELFIPVSTYEKLQEQGASARLLTYLHVREDCLQLYGFSTQEEKDMFLKLISVSGVGPKMGLGILSGTRVDELKRNLIHGAVDALTKLPGLGKKTAQRLVMELKDKFGESDFAGGALEYTVALPSAGKFQEAVLALVSLGYSKSVAEQETRKVLANEPDLAIEELIKRILR